MIIALVIIVIAAGIYFNFRSLSNTNELQTQNIQSSDNIEIKGFAFSPDTLTINVGDTVTWTNMDSAKHTITSDSGSELDSELLSKNQIYSHTFNTKGTYDYHCSVHTSMTGNIIVE